MSTEEKKIDPNKEQIMGHFNPIMKEKKIKLYWLPRSGGSFLRQVLLHLFDVETTGHTFIETDLPIVIGYRDFRDCICSQWRIHYGEFDENRNLASVPEPNNLAKCLKKVQAQSPPRDRAPERHNGFLTRWTCVTNRLQ